MKDLEKLLRDPRAHADAPAEDAWRAWSEEALERWSTEQAQAKRSSPWRAISNALFYAAGLAALWVMLPFLATAAESFGASLGSLHLWISMPNPWVLVGLAVGLSVFLTPPLRQRLLQELS